MFAVTFTFLCPESPHHLIAKGNQKKALTALKFLRGQNDDNVKAELKEIEVLMKESMDNNAGMLDLFRSQANQKGFGEFL